MPRFVFLLLAPIIAIATIRAGTQSNALFTFHSNAWLNLHHFVRLSARGGPAPTELSKGESRQWTAGVELYKRYAARDLLFEDGMVAIKSALRGAEGRADLEGITLDADLKATLERLMPIRSTGGHGTTVPTARGSRRPNRCSIGMVHRSARRLPARTTRPGRAIRSRWTCA